MPREQYLTLGIFHMYSSIAFEYMGNTLMELPVIYNRPLQ